MADVKRFGTYAAASLAGALFALLVFSSSGFAHAGMNMPIDSQTAACPFMGGAVCTMSPLEHLAAWQNAFRAAFVNDRAAAQLLIASALLLVAGFLQNLAAKRGLLLLQRPRGIPRRETRILGPLQEAFSNGILNPKVF